MNSSSSVIEIAKAYDAKKVWIGRVPKGGDIITAIEAFCMEHNIQTGWVNALGAVDKATLAYYGQVDHQYHTKIFEGEYEIVSCMGNISLKEGKPFAHLHITLSDEEFHCFGGHLMPDDTSVFACEFSIIQLTGTPPLMRECDVDTGLTLWMP